MQRSGFYPDGRVKPKVAENQPIREQKWSVELLNHTVKVNQHGESLKFKTQIKTWI